MLTDATAYLAIKIIIIETIYILIIPMKKRYLSVCLLVLFCLQHSAGFACTNFLLSKGSTTDGSTMITYAADSHTRYGQLRYHAGGTHQPGETVKLYNYGSLKFQIEIPQVAYTYRVVGFINEHQFAIGETTWGGIEPLSKGNPEGIDYGNLMYLALQRARNCREAIKVMADLVATYGYADGGESFSLCDPEEVWLFEITSKGAEKGAVWVARRVPEGYVSAHANQARITTFPQEPARWKKNAPHPAISSKHLEYIKPTPTSPLPTPTTLSHSPVSVPARRVSTLCSTAWPTA